MILFNVDRPALQRFLDQGIEAPHVIYNKKTNMWTPMNEEQGLYTYEMYVKRRKKKPESEFEGTN